jgi:hypothetical protein
MAIEVFKIKYTRPLLEKNITWTAHIAAYSYQEAQNYLLKTIGTRVFISEYTSVCRLDAVSDELREKIIGDIKYKTDKTENEEKKVGRPSGPSSVKKDTKKISIGVDKIEKKED